MKRRDGILGLTMVLLLTIVGHGTWFALIGWLLAFAMAAQFLLLVGIEWFLGGPPRDFVVDPETDDGRDDRKPRVTPPPKR